MSMEKVDDRNATLSSEITKLRNEIEFKQKELAKIERRKNNGPLGQIEEREELLRKRLAELNKTGKDVPEDWEAMRQKLAVLMQDKKKRDEDDRKFDDYVGKLEKEKELEKLVRRKIELEKIQNQNQILTQAIEQRQSELEGIKEEAERRDINSVELLGKALQKAEVLQKHIAAGALSKRQQALLAESYLTHDEEAKKVREGIMQDLRGKMVREQREAMYKSTMSLKSMNTQRLQLSKEEEEIYFKRATIQKLEERGYDFLAEVQLGNAPPLDYITKNLDLVRDKVVGEELERKQMGEFNPEEESRKVLDGAEARIALLRQRIQETESQFIVDQPYVPPQTKLNPVSKAVAEQMLGIILRLAGEKIATYERWLNEMREKSKYFLRKSGANKKKIAQIHHRIAIYESAEGVTQNAMNQIFGRLVEEVMNINVMAENMAAEIICKALAETRQVKLTPPQMVEALQELQSSRTQLKNEGRARVHHTVIANSVYVEMKASGKSRDVLLKDLIDNDKEVYDSEAVKIDPRLDCIIRTESKLLIDREAEFWSSFELRFKGPWLGSSSTSYGISALTISANSRFAAIAITKRNFILVYDINRPVPRVVRVAKEGYGEVVDLSFSYDNWSHLMSICSNGTAKLYSTKASSNEVATSCQYTPRDAEGSSAQDLTEVCALTCNHLITELDRFVKDIKQELFIVAGGFHPSFDLFGLQKSIIVAAANGAIVKWNSNVSFDKREEVESKYKYVYCPVVSKKEIAFPLGSRVAAQFAPKAGVATSKDAQAHILREFHYEHKTRIVLLQYVGNGSRLVSVDVSGHIFIWDYTVALLKPSMSFKPHYKGRLVLDVPQYVPQGGTVAKFPPQPSGIKVPRALNPTRLSREDRLEIEEYMQNLSLDAIVNEAILTEKTADGSVKYVVPPRVMPEYGGVAAFNEYTIFQENVLLLHVQQNYGAVQQRMKVIGAKLSKTREYIIIQLLLPFTIPKPEVGYLEFVVFKLKEMRLNRVKVRIDVEVRPESVFPFEVTENIGPWDVPYVCLMLNDMFSLYSLMTGQRVMNVSLKNDIMSTARQVIPISGIHCSQEKVIFWSNKYDSALKYEWVPNVAQEVINKVCEQLENYIKSWNSQ